MVSTTYSTKRDRAWILSSGSHIPDQQIASTWVALRYYIDEAHSSQRVRGSLATHDQGLIITTSDFSPGARKEAERADAVPVALMNGEQLALLLAEHEVGVTRRSHEMLELAETDLYPGKEGSTNG